MGSRCNAETRSSLAKEPGQTMTEDKSAIRHAATVIVLRDRATNPRVLMGQRGAGAAFMPNKFVFPGGAMDLAIGAKQTWVMMDLLTKQGQSKLVSACSYPLTGIGCVKRVYTDLATLACTANGLLVIDMVPGLTLEALSELIGVPLA